MACIKQISDRKFKVRVSNGYRPDGKKNERAKTFIVPNTVPKRGIRQYMLYTAEEFEREVKQGYGEDANTKFRVFAEQWLARQVQYKPSTLATYRQSLAVVYPYIGEIPLSKLRPIALEYLVAELRKRQVKGKPIKEVTVKRYLESVSAVLSDAVRNRMILHNPVQMLPRFVLESIEQIIPTTAEITAFVSALSGERAHYRIYYLMAIYTGCRRGELCALRWSDITPMGDSAKVTVSRSRSAVKGLGIIEGKPKNGRARTVFLEERMAAMLWEYRAQQQANHQAKGLPNADYLFSDEDGNLPFPDSFSRRLRSIYNQLGFSKEYHLHTLRHYFVTTLLHAGVDTNTVAELAGHGDTSFLERTYCHPEDTHKQNAAQCLGKTLQDVAAFPPAVEKETPTLRVVQGGKSMRTATDKTARYDAEDTQEAEQTGASHIY